MMHDNFDMKAWRARTVETYRQYLKRPDLSPEEYSKIRKGIEELEQIPL